MESTTAIDFSGLARSLASACHQLGLTAPGFKAPPRAPGRTRTVRRYPDGSHLVSVVIQGRSAEAVVNDMIEGVLVVNHLVGVAGEDARVLLHGTFTTPTSKAA